MQKTKAKRFEIQYSVLKDEAKIKGTFVIESAKNRGDASRLAKLNVSTKERVFIQYVKILKVKRVSTDSAAK
ncbi:hypothetical protein ABEP42_13145 [Priestia megaterium]|uniref:hypothetical protein n=1 Tax=Priestia TaxID=2800373 RepID=UPI001F141D70|nr:hypothetical protein [Priestia megaterium]UMZ31385.1 hypothetical protein MGJ28_17645 [Priestia megaterium]